MSCSVFLDEVFLWWWSEGGWEGEGCDNVGQGVNEVCMEKDY